ncbi:MAG: protein phosphatase CheZ [Alphaproteobacteria bacterium]
MSGSLDQEQLAKQLLELQKAEPGTVPLEEVSAVVAGIMDAARKELASSDNEVVAKMIGLADYIEQAKQEIAALRPDEVKDRHLPAASDELDEIVAETEACSFQDITGQRVAKVVKALKDIEEKVDSLITAFGDEIAEYKSRNASDGAEETPTDENEITDDMLLQGPQLSDEAMSQDDIDKLLNSA